MNSRINELFVQALDAAVPETWSTLNPTQLSKFKEKFAELIVRECIDKIETYRIPVGNSASGELACEWTYDALKEIRDNIKETFGIK
jgi:hypothetical protein